MEQIEVEILGQVITHQYGVLNTGDVLRTDAAFAKHLVDDCGAAKYRAAPAATAVKVAAEVEPPQAAGAEQSQEPAAAPAPDIPPAAKPGKKK